MCLRPVLRNCDKVGDTNNKLPNEVDMVVSVPGDKSDSRTALTPEAVKKLCALEGLEL